MFGAEILSACACASDDCKRASFTPVVARDTLVPLPASLAFTLHQQLRMFLCKLSLGNLALFGMRY
jgi:hypothetical protein